MLSQSDFNEKEMMGWQWHQLDHMQISCSLLRTDNHASTSSLNFSTDRLLFLTPTNTIKTQKAIDDNAE